MGTFTNIFKTINKAKDRVASIFGATKNKVRVAETTGKVQASQLEKTKELKHHKSTTMASYFRRKKQQTKSSSGHQTKVFPLGERTLRSFGNCRPIVSTWYLPRERKETVS